MSRPNFIGIGAPKCGTTWLAQVIADHPDVFVAHGKELTFFSSDEKFAQGIQWYLNHFDSAKTETAIGEFSVDYMDNAERTATRIHDFNPNVRIIAVVRDPVERAFSHYRWLRQLGNLSCGFREAVQKEPRIIQFSRYYENLKPFWNRFDTEQILILNYHDIEVKPRKVEQLTYAFLAVDQEFRSRQTGKVIGKTISPRFTKLERARVKSVGFLRRKNLRIFLTLYKRLGLSQLYRKMNDSKRKTITLTKDDENFAYQLLRNDLVLFQEQVQFDTSSWFRSH